ncbi:BREX system ATP-binding domain-containing protein [Paenibacillus roseipurpureus]|uniref:DUF2791 family P-loop domain-containing protein n=1 Tax=Paenibacillus roseopurpureus TaxID=2918901 RepID=A0AA96LPZ8_9BACL|nr:BREX system ATP-binding domain-containing protein [Paenibacillus sp. MBLB1832]WNR45151.1 DUF2791 family P-loop domain-containing protein [Paenibacillus sp. MBLB1832]
MWTPTSGDRVSVSGLGSGTVVKETPRGAIVDLDEPVSTRAEFTISHLTLTSPVQHLEQEMLKGRGTSPLGSTQFKNATSNNPIVEIENSLEMSNKIMSRRSLESLRFGLVPHHHIEEFTLEYDQLSEWVIQSFSVDSPKVHKIIGPYGTGKSHTMSVIRGLARSKGYMVASVEVDGQLISLSEPGKLLHSIYSTLHSVEGETEFPIVQLLEKALIQSSLNSYSVSGLRRVDDHLAVVSYLKHAGLLEQWIEKLEAVFSGSEEFTAASVIKELRRYKTGAFSLHSPIPKKLYERPDGFVESLVCTAWLAKAAGYRGLLITIDEFEVEDANLESAQKKKLMQSLEAIERYVSGHRNLPNVPLGIYFGTLGDLNNEGDRYLDRITELSGGAQYKLRFFSREERIDLARRIHVFYQEAYELNQPYQPEAANNVHTILENKGYDDDSGLLRHFIKWYMALLDVNYGPPGRRLVHADQR